MARLGMVGAVVMGIVAGFVLSGLSGLSTASVRSQEPPLAERVRQLEDRMAAVEARLAALDGIGAGSAPPAQSAPSAPPAVALLIDTSGRGEARTESFQAPSARVTICWEITDAAGQVDARIELEATPGLATVTARTVDRAGMDCFTANVEIGRRYQVWVFPSRNSADFRWRVTVQPA